MCTALGIVIEGWPISRLRKAPSLAVLITAIGVSYFLQNSALLIWGSAPKSYPSVHPRLAHLMDGQLVISGGTDRHRAGQYRHHGRADAFIPGTQVRQGDARRVRGQGARRS